RANCWWRWLGGVGVGKRAKPCFGVGSQNDGFVANLAKLQAARPSVIVDRRAAEPRPGGEFFDGHRSGQFGWGDGLIREFHWKPSFVGQAGSPLCARFRACLSRKIRAIFS